MIFEQSIASSLRALDRVSFLGTRIFRCSRREHPFALRLDTSQLTEGLALVGIYSANVYLGYETIFGSPGAGPVILPSQGERWVMIALPHVLQVSSHLDIWYIYSTDITEWERTYPGSFCSNFGPPRQGGQNYKNGDCAGSCCTVTSPLRIHTLVCIRE